ncbi:hypothetical protein PVL29_011558 [Vitis rotundifolia]|uniref:Late embryogenesis abundant protein n=1 Tax=Vitis rotundifolia TaxID=103349 RepID=A0AA38ZNX0_VITRO|nr:hypothetical protein PVL29_011558 [Vitis rotundifolia]
MASQQQPRNLSQSDQICQDGPCEQNASYTQQASNFLQQTGEQVKNMAQGAAEAVKNTLGMNNENADNSVTANLPSNTSNPSNLSNPSNPSNLSNPTTKI